MFRIGNYVPTLKLQQAAYDSGSLPGTISEWKTKKTYRTIEELRSLPDGPGVWRRVAETQRHRAYFAAITRKTAD